MPVKASRVEWPIRCPRYQQIGTDANDWSLPTMPGSMSRINGRQPLARSLLVLGKIGLRKPERNQA